MNTKSKKIRNLFLCLGALALTVGGMSLKAADKDAAAPQALPEIKLQPAEPKAAVPVVAPETVLVKINGEEIKQAQVDEIANQMMQQFSKQFGGQMMPGGMPPEILEQARGRALSQLTQKTLIDQALKEMKKEPTEAEIKAEMDRFDAVIKSNNTTDSLARQLAEAKKQEPGLDIEAKFKEDLKNIIQQIALVEKECKIKIDLTDAEVKAKFDKDPSKYNKVRASHILIATKPQEGTAVTVDKDALATATLVLKEVKDGKDFAALAKKYSDDPGSKDNGGDLDFFTKDKMVPEFADAAFKLKKGETSGLVKSQFGYHIIKVTDIKEGNFENAKPMIFMEDRSEKMKKYFPEAMEKISKRAKIEDLRPKTEAPKSPLGGLTPAAPAEEKAEEKK